jgi:signal transduction histidine kinase
MSRRPESKWHELAHLVWRQLLWAVPFAVFFGTLTDRPRLAYYLLSFKASLVFSYCIGLALWVGRHVILQRLNTDETDRGYPLRIGLALGLTCTAGSYAAAVIIHFTVIPGFLGSARAVFISGMFTILFFTLFAGVNFAIAYYRVAVDRARAMETLRAELAEAELRALRAQINPHFLFNTLNAIASLIRSDPVAAEDTTTRLADVFRYALNASDSGLARLGDELAFLRDYLAIERTRYGEQLHFEERIEPGLDGVLVPSLLLQPIVENAVRHGISGKPGGGRVVLEARRDGDRFHITVSDDGLGFEGASRSTGAGFGLHSVRERLRAAGPPHAIEIASEPGRGTRVQITLPLTPSPSPPPTSPPTKGTCP